MSPLTPYPPQIGLRTQLRLPRNYYATVDTNRYWVDPLMINRTVTDTADLDRIKVCGPGGIVAADHKSVWGSHRTVTDPHHAAIAKKLRHQQTSR